jgi:hypothetical protein
MAAVMMASGMVLTMVGNAHAQRAVYRTVSGHGHTYGCPCPTDCPPATGEAADEGMGAEAEGEDLPEVADLTSDASFASASQSAAPNAIGDSLPPGILIDLSTSYGDVYGVVSPAGGRRFKATNNNSAIPQCRVFFNYNHYENALTIAGNDGANPDVVQNFNVDHYEIGGEHAFWCGMASIQVRVPVNTSLDSSLNVTTLPFGDDTELGNINVSLKGVLYQDCCKTISLGLGADLPTADDITVTDTAGNFDFVFENEAVILSPYLAAYSSIGCSAFVNTFAQVAIPVNENSVLFDDGTAVTGDFNESTLLYLDASVGYWLSQDCCGNGIAAIAELHYTRALDDEAVVVGDAALATAEWENLNATMGAAVVNGCWSVAPALVLPLLDDPDRSFDWEIAVYVNRRF